MTIKVLHLRPGLPHQIVEVDPDDSQAMAALIDGGYMEMLTLTDDGIAMFCDEDGARKGLPMNFAVNNIAVLGPAYFFRKAEPDIAGVTDDDVARIMEWISRA